MAGGVEVIALVPSDAVDGVFGEDIGVPGDGIASVEVEDLKTRPVLRVIGIGGGRAHRQEIALRVDRHRRRVDRGFEYSAVVVKVAVVVDGVGRKRGRRRAAAGPEVLMKGYRHVAYGHVLVVGGHREGKIY